MTMSFPLAALSLKYPVSFDILCVDMTTISAWRDEWAAKCDRARQWINLCPSKAHTSLG